MSKDYCMYFVKDNRYRGGWAFTSFTTRGRVIDPIKSKHPEIFKGDFYRTHDEDYQAIEVQVSEKIMRLLDTLAWRYAEDVWVHFFRELGEAMDLALKEGFSIFLG